MLIVQKFGGTSVADVERIRAVAKRALDTHRAGHEVVVVVSAMAGETNRLLRLAAQVWDETDRSRGRRRSSSTGEQVTGGLIALAIRELGGNARSFLGHQIRIVTDTPHGRARIQEIESAGLATAIGRGKIAVVAGFQGVDEEGNITTLGRGGSDTTAVAIAAALKADVCEIYTDVDGVYTADPNVVPTARKIERISYEEMLELASLGRQGAADPLGRVRHEVWRPDPRALELQRRTRAPGWSARRHHGAGRRLRRDRGPRRGQGHRAQPARLAGRGVQAVHARCPSPGSWST